MKLYGAVGGGLFCLMIAVLGGAGVGGSTGCSSSSGDDGSSSSGSSSGGIPVPAGCNSDPTLSCVSGSDGITCPSGTTPDSTAGVCSDPSDQGNGTDGFCCIAITDTGCTQDDTVQGCDFPSFGFSCAGGSADPSADDPSLTCSQPTTDPNTGDDLYCCVDNGSTGSGSGSGSGSGGCSDDGSLSCDAGASGVSCPTGTTPDTGTFGICSDPSDQGNGIDGFCCVDQTFTDCQEDDTVTASCDFPSFGFSCSAGSPDPSTDDTSLTCSQPTTDPNTGNDLYCCQ